MRHTITSEGFGVRLRPVQEGDAAFIVWLRNLEHAKGRVGDSATEVSSQAAWLEKYFARDDDYYFLIETVGGVPAGTYGLWDVQDNSAESGRWITRPGVPAAIPSAILGLDIAFDALKLDYLRVKTVVTNQGVLSLNRKFGMRQTFVEKDSVRIGGEMVDQIHFTLHPPDWKEARQRLLPLAQVAQKEIASWETAQVSKPDRPWQR